METTEKWTRDTGRLRFYSFGEFMQTGIQRFPKARKIDLKKSWKLTQRILRTRAQPRIAPKRGRKEWIVFRRPRIAGEEYLTTTLNAMKSMLEGATPL